MTQPCDIYASSFSLWLQILKFLHYLCSCAIPILAAALTHVEQLLKVLGAYFSQETHRKGYMQSQADTSAAPADAAEKSATKPSRQDKMCIESLPSSAPHIMYPIETKHQTYTILGIARVIVTHAYGKFSS